jgi:integrase/recombinase XerD
LTERLETVLERISTVPNPINSSLIQEFYQFMVDNHKSDSYKKNNIKALILFSHELAPNVTFYDLQKKEKILEFLNKRIKSKSDDPDEKWITTWNDYLGRIKFFFRWLYNYKIKMDEGSRIVEDMEEWETPELIRIRKKKTKRDSPYSEAEIWEQDELLTIIKYESYTRNKAALALFWDFNARNHEVTKLKIKNIRLRERYGEGEVPYEAKTGSGPILLTLSFPYVRDLLNQHPLRSSSDAALICNLINSRPVTPDAMWTMMKQLRLRIIRTLESGEIRDSEEKEKINENPDDDVFIKPVWKTRTQELADRRREREFPGSDDIMPMLRKNKATLVKSEEYLHTGDKETFSKQRLDEQRESRNRTQGRYWTWH